MNSNLSSALADGLHRLVAGLAEFRRAWSSGHGRSAPPDRRHVNAILTLTACGAIAFIAVDYDASTSEWARGLPDRTVRFFAWITKFGESGWIFGLIGIAGATAMFARGRGLGVRVDAGLTQIAARAMFLFIVCAGSGIASQVLKHLFGRARPKLHEQFPEMIGVFHFDLFSIWASYASFPSGHAVTAFAMTTAVGFLSPLLGILLAPLAFAIAASRVIIGSHYASDVFAGAFLGVFSAFVIRAAFAARKIVFDNTPRGVILRARGSCWFALRRFFRRRATS